MSDLKSPDLLESLNSAQEAKIETWYTSIFIQALVPQSRLCSSGGDIPNQLPFKEWDCSPSRNPSNKCNAALTRRSLVLC
jgi:hypothetical protein